MSASVRLVRVLTIHMKNNMRNLRYILVLVTFAVLAACSGNIDDTSLPVLTVSDDQIDLASETQAVFTVTYDGKDVTSESEIVAEAGAKGLEGCVYKPSEPGSASFHAVYDGKESNVVSVNVVNSKPQVVSAYKRNICVIEFTGAWCVNCPGGYDNMKLQLSKPSMSKYKENIHVCAFHSNLEGTDTLGIDATQDVIKLFTGLAYPSFSVDLRDSGLLTSDGIGQFVPAILSSVEDYGPHCGVAVSSALSADKTKAAVEVKVTSELTSEYRVVLMIVQNGIKGYQKHSEYGELSTYTHNHVVRKVVTSYAGRFTGEKITEDGLIASGTEKTRTWNVDVEDKWVSDDTWVYALVLDSNGYVNNMNLCLLDGGDSGYELK